MPHPPAPEIVPDFVWPGTFPVPTNVHGFFLPGTAPLLVFIGICHSRSNSGSFPKTRFGEIVMSSQVLSFLALSLLCTAFALARHPLQPLDPLATTLPLPRSLPNLGQNPCQRTALLASLNSCAHDAVHLDSQTFPMLASFIHVLPQPFALPFGYIWFETKPA